MAGDESISVSSGGKFQLDDIFEDFLFATDNDATQSISTTGTKAKFEEDDVDDISGSEDGDGGCRRKKPRNQQRLMTEEQKVERR